MTAAGKRISWAFVLCLLCAAGPARADPSVPAAPTRAQPSPARAQPSPARAQPSAPARTQPSVAPAPAPPPHLDATGPDSEAKARARILFERGASAYREARFSDAVDIFLETNRLYPNPELLFNVAKAYDSLGNTTGALRYYRDYVRRAPDAPDRKDVDARIQKLEGVLSQRGVQQVSIFSTPDRATLFIDGQAVGLTPWTGETFAGNHRIALERTGFLRSENLIELDLHRSRDFSFELGAEPPKPILDASPPAPDPGARSKPSAFTLATLATGVALLGTALIGQVASGGDSKGISRTSAFFAGSGAGVTVLGGVMLYFDLSPKSESSKKR